MIWLNCCSFSAPRARPQTIMTTVAAADKTPVILGEENLTPAGAKWLQLKQLKCKDPQGRPFNWEYVERVTKYRETDGAAVFAKVTAPGQADSLVVIAQWRPPLRTFVLELPAGVIEQGETVEQLAVRELKEETGYAGQVTRVTTEAANDQGLTNSCLNFAFATVDTAAPENLNPEPTPELGENIQVLLLPLKGLSGELTRLKQQNNWAIDSRLLAFALGLDFAADSSLTAAAASDN